MAGAVPRSLVQQQIKHRNQMTEDFKNLADAGMTTTAFGSVLGYLPEIAACLSILWACIRIYEWMRVRLFKYPPSNGQTDA